MTPRCPGGATFPRQAFIRDDFAVGECQSCGRVVRITTTGKLRVHGVASSWQPERFEEAAR